MTTKFAVIILIYLVRVLEADIQKLPYCSDEPLTGSVLVSTLDGKLSRIDSKGELKWQIDTEPGPLLASNIHSLELTNNGQFVRIIPSLAGSLYKFDGTSVDSIGLNAESLLKSSHKYSDDLVVAGSIDVRTYGVGFRSGIIIYECNSSKCINGTHEWDRTDDVLILTRNSQSVRAVEVRTGSEKWNFSVGLHHVKLPQITCIVTESTTGKLNVTAVLPDGLIQASYNINGSDVFWQYTFDSPITKVWKHSGYSLDEVDIFAPQFSENLAFISVSPAVYVGMHERQLYIHESAIIQNRLNDGEDRYKVGFAESSSVLKLPWKPIPASNVTNVEDSTTALSVLYSSSFINGNGYFLYTETDWARKNNLLCETNQTNTTINIPIEVIEQYTIVSMWVWWKEITVISITTAIVFNILYRCGQQQRSRLLSGSDTSRQSNTPNSIDKALEFGQSSTFTSRYENEFETVECIGRGGFGVVFEAKLKIDECNYAVKRTVLPREKCKQDRVMREVKALASLEHQNIVRYFTSWLEAPPLGWANAYPSNLAEDTFALSGDISSVQTCNKRSRSVSVLVDRDTKVVTFDDTTKSDSNDFICFEKGSQDITEPTVSSTKGITHSQKKINWKRPSRKSHSFDLKLFPKEPPIYLYIQMQLCRKESLKDWLLENKHRDISTVRNFFSQIVSAVEYIHLRRLIHRDLKPSNILFSLDGLIKVGDFGLAKDMESNLDLDVNSSLTSRSNHTREVGTRLYMSPEQLSSGKYNFKVDIFSLGLILYELLIPFSTDMERIQTLSNLKTFKFSDDFKRKHSQEYELLQQMVCLDPKLRLTTFGIRARPPFNQEDAIYGKEYHFDIPKFIRSHSN